MQACAACRVNVEDTASSPSSTLEQHCSLFSSNVTQVFDNPKSLPVEIPTSDMVENVVLRVHDHAMVEPWVLTSLMTGFLNQVNNSHSKTDLLYVIGLRLDWVAVIATHA